WPILDRPDSNGVGRILRPDSGRGQLGPTQHPDLTMPSMGREEGRKEGVTIQNVHIRRGLLMLVPEVIEVLGGLVEDLEAARERLVHEVNKPPRGKRKQPVLSLSERASLAAWPSSITRDIEEANLSIPHDGNFSQTARQGVMMLGEIAM
ncbi:hypothetical protein Taro_026431, partial [Colocasia esculenta]|nr:hypothetical protein [Colocasia esculenta]